MLTVDEFMYSLPPWVHPLLNLHMEGHASSPENTGFNVHCCKEWRLEMMITSLILGSVLLGATWALDSLTLPESSRVLLLGVILVVIALWSRRYSNHRENS
jgi:hypothetical protein